MDVFTFNAEHARYRAQLRRDLAFMLFMLVVAIVAVWYVESSPVVRWGSFSVLLLLLIPYVWYQDKLKALRARGSREREDARFEKLRANLLKSSSPLVREPNMTPARVVELSKRVQYKAERRPGDDRTSKSSSSSDDNTTLNTVLLMSALDDTPTRSTYTPSSSYCSSSSSSYSSSSYDSGSSSSDSGSSSSSCD